MDPLSTLGKPIGHTASSDGSDQHGKGTGLAGGVSALQESC